MNNFNKLESFYKSRGGGPKWKCGRCWRRQLRGGGGWPLAAPSPVTAQQQLHAGCNCDAGRSSDVPDKLKLSGDHCCIFCHWGDDGCLERDTEKLRILRDLLCLGCQQVGVGCYDWASQVKLLWYLVSDRNHPWVIQWPFPHKYRVMV